MSKPITLNHYKILFNFLQVFKANKLSEIVAPNGAIFAMMKRALFSHNEINDLVVSGKCLQHV